jgi:hypothetical protein
VVRRDIDADSQPICPVCLTVADTGGDRPLHPECDYARGDTPAQSVVATPEPTTELRRAA